MLPFHLIIWLEGILLPRSQCECLTAQVLCRSFLKSQFKLQMILEPEFCIQLSLQHLLFFKRGEVMNEEKETRVLGDL